MPTIFKDPHFHQFYIAITTRCNLNCIMCGTTKHRSDGSKEISTEKWKRIIDNLTKYKLDSIAFGGGEPLLRNDLCELAKYSSKRVDYVDIVSNGIFIREDFLKSIKNEKNINFVVSLDGLEKENDIIRGKGVFKQVTKTLELLKKFNRNVTISALLAPYNFRNYIQYLEFISKNGYTIDIQPLIMNNELCQVPNNFNLEKYKIGQLKEIIMDIHKNKALKLTRPLNMIDSYLDYFQDKLKTQNRCKNGISAFNINEDGTLWLCGKNFLYPLYEHELLSILNSEEYQKELVRIENCKRPCLQGLVI